MDVLILGGTSFVGRWIVEGLLHEGHRPTLFTRGRTGADLFPGVERLVGDRDGDHTALLGRRWDAVVDVCGYTPGQVARSVDALGAHEGRYVFISTAQVYDHESATSEITEGSPRYGAERGDEVTDESYAPLKVACEDDLVDRFGDRATIIRPGFIVGPHDPSDRFLSWVRRAGRGGRMLVPDRLDRPIQVIDVRDLARLVGLLVDEDRGGAFNAVGPAEPITLDDLITACGEVGRVPVPDGARIDFPLVLPDASWDPLFRISAAAAREVGMPATPLAQTIADTRAWDRERGEPPLRAGPSEADEQAALT